MPVSVYRFGDFELDPSRFELRRNQRVLKLERIPMELLILLVEKGGEVASRQEIVDRLWGKDVFVDTESGINTAIRKIRQALRDDPEQPRYVQTVTGKGYRFVGVDQSSRLTHAEAAPASVVAATGTEVAKVAEPEAAARHRPRAIYVVALAVCGLAAAGLAWNGGLRDRILRSSRATQIHSIAVLPLANLSGDAAQDYFVDGLTDEMITALAKNRSLRVVSRTSAMQYKGVQRPVGDIARELGVDGILEGSVTRSGGRVHMTVQLIYAPTDTHVWAESYDRDVNQAFSLPEELSQTVAKEVKSATSLKPAQRPINPEAHDAYMRGRFLFFSDHPGDGRPYFEKAIQIQPDYAAAWSGLADTTLGPAVMDEVPSQEVSAKVEAAARKGLELDDSLPAAHVTMAAWYLFFGWDLQRALAETDRAIELNPNYPDSYIVKGYALSGLNRNDEAILADKKLMELDPASNPTALAEAYMDARRFDEAIAEARYRIAARPTEPDLRYLISACYWFKGMWNESQQEYETALRLSGNPDEAAAAHAAFVRGGEKGVEIWGVQNIKNKAKKHYVAPLTIAGVYTFLGDKEQTLNYLEAAYRAHTPGLILINKEPVYDFIHADPRYQELLRKMNLPAR